MHMFYSYKYIFIKLCELINVTYELLIYKSLKSVRKIDVWSVFLADV